MEDYDYNFRTKSLSGSIMASLYLRNYCEGNPKIPDRIFHFPYDSL
jgi:hypothetical protein